MLEEVVGVWNSGSWWRKLRYKSGLRDRDKKPNDFYSSRPVQWIPPEPANLSQVGMKYQGRKLRRIVRRPNAKKYEKLNEFGRFLTTHSEKHYISSWCPARSSKSIKLHWFLHSWFGWRIFWICEASRKYLKFIIALPITILKYLPGAKIVVLRSLNLACWKQRKNPSLLGKQRKNLSFSRFAALFKVYVAGSASEIANLSGKNNKNTQIMRG